MKLSAFLLFVLLVTANLQAQPDCLKTVNNICYDACKKDVACICDCLIQKAQQLRAAEKYEAAIDLLKPATMICQDKKAQSILDSIQQNYRMWLYKEGAYAIADYDGKPVTPFLFHDPEPFHRGIAIYKDNKKCFFVDKTGRILTQPPGYDGIIPIENGLYYVTLGQFHGLVTDNGTPLFDFYPSFKQGVYTLKEAGNWLSTQQLKSFVQNTTGKYDRLYLFNPNSKLAYKNNKAGIVDNWGHEKMSPRYDQIPPFQDGACWVLENKLWGLLDSNFQPILAPQFDQVKLNYNGTAWAKKRDKWGLLDGQGKAKTLFIFNEVQGFFKGYASVNIGAQMDQGWSLDGHWGVIDSTGTVVVQPNYTQIQPFSEGFAWAYKGGRRVDGVLLQGAWCLLNRQGQEVIAPKYNHVQPFQQGIAWANIGADANLKGGKWELIDTTGRLISTRKYDFASYFTRGTAFVNLGGKYSNNQLVGGLWGKVDQMGREIMPVQFDSVFILEPGRNWLRDKGVWKLADDTGRPLLPYSFEAIGQFLDGLAAVKVKGDWYLADTTGVLYPNNRISNDKYRRYWQGPNTVFENNGLYGLLDKKNRVLVTPQYQSLRHFVGNTYWAQKPGSDQVGLIRGDGQQLTAFDFDSGPNPFPATGPNGELYGNDLFSVSSHKKTGLMDSLGKLVVPAIYDRTGSCMKNIYALAKNGKFGCLNEKGQELIPFEYDEIAISDNKLIWAKKQGQYHLLNEKGKLINRFDFRYAANFYQGMARFVDTLQRSGFVNERGQIVIPAKYIQAFEFTDTVTWAQDSTLRWGLIDRRGKIILNHIYSGVNYFAENISTAGVVTDRRAGTTWYGVIDGKGKVRSDGFNFSFLDKFVNGFSKARLESRWSFVNRQGKAISEFMYDKVEDFDANGVAMVWNGSWMGLIDTTGANVGVFQMDDIFLWEKQTYILLKSGKKGLYFSNTRSMVPPEYEEIAQVGDDWIMVRKNGKWGWIDPCGNAMIPCRYDAATPFNAEGWATVYQFGLQFRINKKGEMVWKTE